MFWSGEYMFNLILWFRKSTGSEQQDLGTASRFSAMSHCNTDPELLEGSGGVGRESQAERPCVLV